ncbi:MAG: GDSL-type esterase/lipase family protein [Sediminibacterium sp.]
MHSYNRSFKVKKVFILFFVIAIFQASSTLQAQPFKQEVAQFQKSDSIVMPPKGQIVFAGSSSFTKWKDVAMYFPGYPIINRGFGGATLVDLIYYVDDAIIQYQPSQVFIYCGENDMADVDTVSPSTVLHRFKTLHGILLKKLPKATKIFFVSIKPSIARWHLESKYLEANNLIKAYIDTQKNCQFLDVHTMMLDENKEVLKDIFIADKLHMNAKGYQIWQKQFVPFLKVPKYLQ